MQYAARAELRVEARDSCGSRPAVCHLTLAGLTYGVGFSLQEAADDLIARLVGIALGARASGFHARPPSSDHPI